ncbi:uncharacterized protein LOC112091765 [Morus notabilis]|uniref:uncharacterized protein LOC112091765 n=1 Tax=Morus notabilis TaxID=981085 RepID=UPI000CED6788|nr:uncharacterized protein LOC112091765 [Morus notabilis]
MATKSCDGTAHHSSIALLQERFRQLQRAKEMRKEKELLRLFSESERTSNPTKRYEPTGLFFFSESVPPHHRPPSHQGSIYVQQNFQGKHGNFQGNETNPIFANMTSTSGAAMNNRTYSFDDSDVDTSLHL